MEAKDTFTLSWCGKHKNWWVTNCPDCMVDDNEESIKQDGRKEVVEWVGRLEPQNEWSVIGRFTYNQWQAKLKEWGIE